MKAKLKKQRQDEQRRMNQAYRELAHVGGYIDRAVKRKYIDMKYEINKIIKR